MKTTGLNFIEAVKAAKDGKKIRNRYWCNHIYVIYKDDKLFLRRSDEDLNLYQVSASSIIADDWEIVPDSPETMGFMEAWAEAKQGKKIARLEWTTGSYAVSVADSNGILRLLERYMSGTVSTVMHICDRHIDATDWYVVEEEVNND